jgi:predicted TIM-barrel fold metal-dependent hydrolase
VFENYLMQTIDSHQHVFWHDRDDAGLVADLDENGIDTAWLLTWDMSPTEHAPGDHPVLNARRRRGDGTHQGIPLDDILTARDRYPDRFVAGFCPHPLLGDAPGMLASATKMYDIRVCGEWKFRILFDDPRSIELFKAAGELKLPVVLHLDVPYLAGENGKLVYQPAWYGGTIDNLERELIACPGTNFIGHAPGFWREISGDAATDPAAYPNAPITPGGRLFRLFDEYPNLYADLSAGSGLTALRRDPAHAQKFVERYADRLLFGRDIYGGDLQAFLKTLELPQQIAQKLFHDNARQLLGR